MNNILLDKHLDLELFNGRSQYCKIDLEISFNGLKCLSNTSFLLIGCKNRYISQPNYWGFNSPRK